MSIKGHAAGSAASHDSGDLLAPQCLNVHRHGELLQQFVNQPVDRIVRNVGRNALYLDGSAAAKLQVETQRREIDRILLEQRIFVFRKRETLREKELLAEGLSPKAAASRAEKTAIEDARFVLPNACDTKMIVTMNARSLMNFFELRCCQRAQWEIREVADQMLRLCLSVAPHLFKNAGPGCVRGGCPEGKMTCGKAAEMREKYARMREEAHG